MSKSKAPKNPIDLALEASLELAAQTPWTDVTLSDIAEQAGLDLTELYDVTDKARLVLALEPWADKAMSAEKADLSETPRERLFDAIMRRFEHFETRRAGVLSMMKERDRSPQGLVRLGRARRKSADWALTAARLDVGSPIRLGTQRLGLMRTLSKTEKAWRTDEAGDYARTMATLDAELLEMEERLNQFARFRDRFRPSGAASSPPEAPQAETNEA